MNLLVVAIVAAVVLVCGINWDKYEDIYNPKAGERRKGYLSIVTTAAFVGLIVWFALNN